MSSSERRRSDGKRAGTWSLPYVKRHTETPTKELVLTIVWIIIVIILILLAIGLARRVL